MLQSFKLALKSIWSNKMRSALTMFGIVIGVASVIILVSLLNGYMQNQLSQWADLGAKKYQCDSCQPAKPLREPRGYVCLPGCKQHTV